MGVRLNLAKASSAMLTWGLQNIARRPGGNLPGVLGLKIDPELIIELRDRVTDGSVVVIGTNGKTTVTNLLANVFEQSGRSVICNRTGANLKSGIATTLLHAKPAQWGVFECDELWSAKVVPELKPTYMLLLNIFRDQLDRCGEIDRIQDAIVAALAGSPGTQLIYNADDPLCEMIALRAQENPARVDSPRSISFGIAESMNLQQNIVTDATMCQRCLHMFEYEYRQYGQLGSYTCPHCGFTRPTLDFAAENVHIDATGLAFDITSTLANMPPTTSIHSSMSTLYMAYNLTAIYAASMATGCNVVDIQKAIDEFDPKNGRLQRYMIEGHPTLLNLAKNPTGFNQNLRIVEADTDPKAVAFFVNDKDVDGHDISWIWDIDFEELVSQPHTLVYAGGNRKNDLQVRLKYAGVNAKLINNIDDVFADVVKSNLPNDCGIYAIANYTALPPVHAKLDAMAKHEMKSGYTRADSGQNPIKQIQPHEDTSQASDKSIASGAEQPVVIAHILPDLLNLYGDGGNVRVLEERLRRRNIPVQVKRIHYGDKIDFDAVDLAVLGGSPDREQRLASEALAEIRDSLSDYIESGAPLLAICGSYQMLGRTWLLDDEEVPGLGILAIETRRPGTSADRLVDNIALQSPLAEHPVIGYENHAGRTYLDEGVKPFGKVISKTGCGNNDAHEDTGIEHGEKADGVLYKGVIGTYLHGPILSKNPEIADWLLERALERRAFRTGQTNETADISILLTPLDDSEELAANEFMADKII